LNKLSMSGDVTQRASGLLSATPSGRLPWFGVVLFCALLFWFTVPTVASLHGAWSSYYYSHGYLVLVLSALLVVLEIRRLPLAVFAPSWWGFACLVFFVLVTLLGRASSTQSVVQLAWPLSWIAAIWTLAGWSNARRFALPLGSLYVAIPVWDFFIEPLRRVTIGVVSAWIHAAGLPAFIDGNMIHVPSGAFEVQGGCAGLRYALVALALGVFSGLFHHRRWAPTALLTLCALALAFIGNWLRVFITVVAGHSPEGWLLLFVRDHHTFFGWVLFVVFMLPVFYLNRVLVPRDLAASPLDAAVDGRMPVVLRTKGVAYASCAVFAVAIWLSPRDVEPSGTVAFEAPEIAGWNRTTTWQDIRSPFFEGSSGQVASWYANGAVQVGAYVATYATQDEGHEIRSSVNRPTGRSGVVTARQSVAVATASGVQIPFQELEVSDSDDNRRLVWVGTRVAGNLAINSLVAKALQISGAIRGRHDAQALVITAMCDGNCTETRSSLSRFAAVAAEPLYEQAERSIRARQASDGADDRAEQ